MMKAVAGRSLLDRRPLRTIAGEPEMNMRRQERHHLLDEPGMALAADLAPRGAQHERIVFEEGRLLREGAGENGAALRASGRFGKAGGIDAVVDDMQARGAQGPLERVITCGPAQREGRVRW